MPWRWGLVSTVSTIPNHLVGRRYIQLIRMIRSVLYSPIQRISEPLLMPEACTGETNMVISYHIISTERSVQIIHSWTEKLRKIRYFESELTMRGNEGWFGA